MSLQYAVVGPGYIEAAQSLGEGLSLLIEADEQEVNAIVLTPGIGSYFIGVVA